jgi:hypothetical protein
LRRLRVTLDAAQVFRFGTTPDSFDDSKWPRRHSRASRASGVNFDLIALISVVGEGALIAQILERDFDDTVLAAL